MQRWYFHKQYYCPTLGDISTLTVSKNSLATHINQNNKINDILFANSKQRKSES